MIQAKLDGGIRFMAAVDDDDLLEAAVKVTVAWLQANGHEDMAFISAERAAEGFQRIYNQVAQREEKRKQSRSTGG